MIFDNVIIHYYPYSKYIAKCAVNMRNGKKIVCRVIMKDLVSVNNWMFARGYQDMPHKLIIH